MKILQWTFGMIASISVIAILLITAFEIGAYSNYGWYKKTYDKYGVLEDLDMKMDDVMYITEEMMAYLRGNRDDLEVNTIVNGEKKQFFNDREKAHMVDVKNLFVGGLWIRRIAIVFFVMVLVALIKTKADWKRLISKSFLFSFGAFLGITAGVGVLFMSDFNKYFLLFHKVFFTNDLWILDPRTDLLIRMLPEGFFMDMVVRIGIIFLRLLLLGVIISIIALYRPKNKNN